MTQPLPSGRGCVLIDPESQKPGCWLWSPAKARIEICEVVEGPLATPNKWETLQGCFKVFWRREESTDQRVGVTGSQSLALWER